MVVNVSRCLIIFGTVILKSVHFLIYILWLLYWASIRSRIRACFPGFYLFIFMAFIHVYVHVHAGRIDRVLEVLLARLGLFSDGALADAVRSAAAFFFGGGGASSAYGSLFCLLPFLFLCFLIFLCLGSRFLGCFRLLLRFVLIIALSTDMGFFHLLLLFFPLKLEAPVLLLRYDDMLLDPLKLFIHIRHLFLIQIDFLIKLYDLFPLRLLPVHLLQILQFYILILLLSFPKSCPPLVLDQL